MFYIIKFNAAIAQLGVDPTSIPAEYRQLGQDAGKASGCNPKEAAIIVLGELPLEYRMITNPSVGKEWFMQGKVDLENTAIKRAFSQLGWNWQ